MQTRPFLSPAVVLAVLFVAVHRPSAQTAAAEPPRAEAIVDNGEFMDLFMEPLFEELKKAANKSSPSRKDMAAVYSASIRLAEMSNLLFVRDSNRYTSLPEWPHLAAAMREKATTVADATLVALRNARPKDFEPVKASVRQVAEACNTCHRELKTDAKTVKP